MLQILNLMRSRTLQFSERMCRPKEGYQKIVGLVHTLGMRHPMHGDKGVKIFLAATVMKKGKILRVFPGKREPPQSW